MVDESSTTMLTHPYRASRRKAPRSSKKVKRVDDLRPLPASATKHGYYLKRALEPRLNSAPRLTDAAYVPTKVAKT